MIRRLLASALGAALLVPAAAIAQDGFAGQLAARQGQFDILALNIGVLGGMARGNTPYDAAMAQQAADNIVAVSRIAQTFNWPEGSDNMSIEGTRALPAIWDNLDDVVAKWAALGTAAEGLAAVAGTGQEALGPALGAVGGTCQACHEAYRAPEN
ncbi:c-type cytochrome [Palleronia sp. KMU-117]|uniref:c-type cytochrome n=1 Tax=Palleronia sp. KMU-117 TaxID=3434108 RepID=UPI003D70A64B